MIVHNVENRVTTLLSGKTSVADKKECWKRLSHKKGRKRARGNLEDGDAK